MRLPEKLNSFSNISMLESILEQLYHNIEDMELFFETNTLLLKKVLKTPQLLHNAEKNIKSDKFADKLTEVPEKFVAWLVSN